MSTASAAALRRLSHDVGKYVARTARNLPAGPVPDVLREMLIKDLYALSDGRRASEVFDDRIQPLMGSLSRLAVERCQALLAEVDTLEDRVRAGEEVAIRRAAQCALEVSDTIAELVREGVP